MDAEEQEAPLKQLGQSVQAASPHCLHSHRGAVICG